MTKQEKPKQDNRPTLFAQTYAHFGFSPGGVVRTNGTGVRTYWLPLDIFHTAELLKLAEDFVLRDDLTGVDQVILDPTPRKGKTLWFPKVPIV